MRQDKTGEKTFFNRFASLKAYDVFTPYGYKSIIKAYLKLLGKRTNENPRTLDLGCGSGAFTRRFKDNYAAYTDDADFFGLDISQKSAALATQLSTGIYYCAGDIEQCCFKDETFNIVLFSGVLHHFADYETCLREGFRILKRGGCLLSYDPHKKNPAMWLYRHPKSPFFSKKGKTANERLLAARPLAAALEEAGFHNTHVHCISGVTFRYVASPAGRFFLPIYNLFEILLGKSPLAAQYGSFVIGYGEKP